MAKEVAILGVGMHPWGKWGKNFVEYGLKACNDALDDAGLAWKDIEVVTDLTGKPSVAIHGAAKEICDELGISEVLISLSHCRSHATATAIAVGNSAD